MCFGKPRATLSTLPVQAPLSSLLTSRPIVLGFFSFYEHVLAGTLVYMDVHIHTTQDYLEVVRVLPCLHFKETSQLLKEDFRMQFYNCSR